MFAAHAYVGFTFGKHNMQLLALFQCGGIVHHLTAAGFYHAETAGENVLRRYGLQQGGLFAQTFATLPPQILPVLLQFGR